MSEQTRYNFWRVAAVVFAVAQAVITAAIGQYRDDLGLSAFWVAILSLVSVGISALLLASPRVQGDGKEREA